MKGVFGLLTPMAIVSMRWSFIPRTTASWRLRSRTACQVLAPRLYRQAPLNSTWEGSGNVQCLDVLRALSRDPVARDALFAELHAARGGHTAFDTSLQQLAQALNDSDQLELRSRWIVERLPLILQASLLLRSAPRPIADAFCESRLAGAHGLAFGTLPGVQHSRESSSAH
jgi:hypothetical protein